MNYCNIMKYLKIDDLAPQMLPQFLAFTYLFPPRAFPSSSDTFLWH